MSWKRKVAAGWLLILSSLFIFPGFDLMASTPISGGGSGGTQCSEVNGTLLNVLCARNGGGGDCTPGNIGTSACNLPANGCDGVYRVGIGRCERSTGLTTLSASTVTISSGTTSGSVTVSFPTPFTNAPDYVYFIGATTAWTGTQPKLQVQVPFLSTRNFGWTIPAALTEFPGNQSSETFFNPSTYTQVELSVTFSASTVPAAGSTMYVQISGDGATTWTTLVSFLVDGTAACVVAGASSDFTCSGFVNMPILPALSCVCGNYLLRIAGSGGDGTTKIQWSQIHATFQVTEPSPPVGPIELGAAPLTTSFTARIETPVALPSGVSITVKFFWQTWSYLG
jgi:hypothetical protein